ncbi:hypothetical protein M569_06422 [Genlisea aurea]|uniref:Uncharacterized protein n=1 Tax=Genlisea aurea TaxID=192259 RepID=S8CMI7_9LAMI|nr:hypothetical protein M569_06422 [Genlisea aurea]
MAAVDPLSCRIDSYFPDKSKSDSNLINGHCRFEAVPMDATTSGASSVQYHTIADQKAIGALVSNPVVKRQRHCYGNATPGEFPLSAIFV